MISRARQKRMESRAREETVLAWNTATAIVSLLGASLAGRSLSYDELFEERRPIGGDELAALLMESLGGTFEEGTPAPPPAD